MKATYVFVLLLAIVSFSEANLLTTLGPLISNVLRADIMDIIHLVIYLILFQHLLNVNIKIY